MREKTSDNRFLGRRMSKHDKNTARVTESILEEEGGTG